MKLEIEMSEEFVYVDGFPCRIWNGFADNGVPVRVYVHRVAVPLGQPMRDFDDALLAMKQPRQERREE